MPRERAEAIAAEPIWKCAAGVCELQVGPIQNYRLAALYTDNERNRARS